MTDLFIYRGLPGSGKTTAARALQQKVGGRLVGRDHLRDILFGLDGYEPTSANEKKVSALQDQLIHEGLRADVPVIVDDMNLRDRYMRRFMEMARNEGVELHVIDMTNEDIGLCLLRNAGRDRQVPDHVIEELHSKFIRGKDHPLPLPSIPEKVSQGALYTPPDGKPTAVIVDIDGTVALMSDRSPFDESRVHEDRPNRPVIETVRALHESGCTVLFTSARTAGCRDATASWLSKHTGILDAKLFMRAEKDFRKDSVVKTEIFDNYIRYEYDVRLVLDDRDQVVKNWRGMGLTCLQVAEGNF